MVQKTKLIKKIGSGIVIYEQDEDISRPVEIKSSVC